MHLVSMPFLISHHGMGPETDRAFHHTFKFKEIQLEIRPKWCRYPRLQQSDKYLADEPRPQRSFGTKGAILSARGLKNYGFHISLRALSSRYSETCLFLKYECNRLWAVLHFVPVTLVVPNFFYWRTVARTVGGRSIVSNFVLLRPKGLRRFCDVLHSHKGPLSSILHDASGFSSLHCKSNSSKVELRFIKSSLYYNCYEVNSGVPQPTDPPLHDVHFAFRTRAPI